MRDPGLARVPGFFLPHMRPAVLLVHAKRLFVTRLVPGRIELTP
jgi:hypothetical protein